MATKSFTSASSISTTHQSAGNIQKTEQSGSPYARSDEVADERISGGSSPPTFQNATYIDPDQNFNGRESRNGLDKRERLELYNRGTHNGKWTIDQTQQHDQDDWYMCRAIGAQMRLSDRERLLMWRLFKPLDMRSYRFLEPSDPPITMKQYVVAFCVGAHVYNDEQTDDEWTYYPGRETEKRGGRYENMEALGKVPDGEPDLTGRHRTIKQFGKRLDVPEGKIRACFEKVRTDLPKRITSN